MSLPSYNFPFYWRCKKCGTCCQGLVGKKFGAAITPMEATVLKQLAEYHHVALNIRPLTLDFRGQVTLYQFAEDKCSFLSKVGKCLIYFRRPLFCKMYPLHPAGLCECPTTRDVMRLKPKRVIYPDEMKKAAIDYIKFVIPRCKDCAMRYDLNKGWEANTPFEVGKLTDADLRYADTY